MNKIFTIPKIIHRTWKDTRIPYDIFKKEWVESWKIHNPSWEFRFYTDADIDEFMQSHYPEYITLLDGYDQKIKKVDAFRYFLLYHYGGVYVDLDYECFRPIDAIFRESCNIYLQQNNPDTLRVTNSIMFSSPGHLFWRDAIERLVVEKDLAVPANRHTGPHFVTRVLMSRKYPDVEILEFGKYFCPIAYRDKKRGVSGDYSGRESVFGEHKYAGTW